MIYTVTFNPSLDYILRLDSLEKGEINRVTYEHILPGGKGLNVSMVLKNLGHASSRASAAKRTSYTSPKDFRAST